MKAALLLILALSACTLERRQPATTASDEKSSDPHWTYAGLEGPAEWGKLSPAFATCSSGSHQSPIDIDDSTPADLPAIGFSYSPSGAVVRNNGHTIVVTPSAAESIRIDSAEYRVLQAHFHHPSEHTIDGKRYDLEMHIVHRDAAGKLAVVGVLMQPDSAPNPALQSAWAVLPTTQGGEGNAEIDLASLLPKDRGYYTFDGSLTTPPCDEGVRWIVLRSPVTVGREQIDAFARLFPMNARPVQAGERMVMRSR